MRALANQFAGILNASNLDWLCRTSLSAEILNKMLRATNQILAVFGNRCTDYVWIGEGEIGRGGRIYHETRHEGHKILVRGSYAMHAGHGVLPPLPILTMGL